MAHTAHMAFTTHVLLHAQSPYEVPSSDEVMPAVDMGHDVVITTTNYMTTNDDDPSPREALPRVIVKPGLRRQVISSG